MVFDLEGTLIDSTTKQAFSGFPEILAELGGKNLSLFVWTRASRQSTTKVLKQLDLMRFFWDISCADDESCKPDPSSLRELMGESSRELPGVVIGDSQGDLEGAKNLRFSFLLACWQVKRGEGDTFLPVRFHGYSKTLGVATEVLQVKDFLEEIFD